MKKILVINPGSTSTKIAFYHDGEQVWKESIEHDAAEIKNFFCQRRFAQGLGVGKFGAAGLEDFFGRKKIDDIGVGSVLGFNNHS